MSDMNKVIVMLNKWKKELGIVDSYTPTIKTKTVIKRLDNIMGRLPVDTSEED
ncbi:MAG: hypothetical protein ACXABY_21860 [Candidatus Thorarchaeota archaeon]|jgi:hypothetical protein